MLAWWMVLFASGAQFLLTGVNCATTPYTVHIGTQATVVGYAQDEPPGIMFYGIRYAQPLTSQKRFAPPQRQDPSGQINAFHYGSQCLQPDVPPANHDEDCLFLNIFTPKQTNITQNRFPVYFWIHGGGYVHGSGGLHTDGVFKNLAAHDVIVVSINYRLAQFGFFSTRDSTVPGNLGLRDQIEALNWVKRFIPYFGGDPNRITIGGHSAGSMSCSLLTLSPISQHLFKQAILNSGSGFSTGYLSSPLGPQDEASQSLAVNLGCITAAQWQQHNPAQMAAMLQCLRSKTADAVLHARHSGRFTPVIDGSGGVLPELIENLALKRPPIPVMMGNAHDEWIYVVLSGGLLHNASFVNHFTRQYMTNDVAHSYLLSYFNNPQQVSQAIQHAYVDASSNLNDQDHIGWCNVDVKLYTELQFVGPTYQDAMYFRQTGSPVHLYSFDYLAPAALPTVDPKLRGIGHGWEIQYLFGYPGSDMGGWKVTADDVLTENIMGQYWTNFIKTGNPTPTWPRLGANGEFMSLGPRPTPSTGFHFPGAKFFACTVPTIEGYHQSWCT